jgi:hypothetical protein
LGINVVEEGSVIPKNSNADQVVAEGVELTPGSEWASEPEWGECRISIVYNHRTQGDVGCNHPFLATPDQVVSDESGWNPGESQSFVGGVDEAEGLIEKPHFIMESERSGWTEVVLSVEPFCSVRGSREFRASFHEHDSLDV